MGCSSPFLLLPNQTIMFPTAENIDALSNAPFYVLLVIILLVILYLAYLFVRRESAADIADSANVQKLIKNLETEQDRAQSYNITLSNLAMALASVVEGFNKTKEAIAENTVAVERSNTKIDATYVLLTSHDESSRQRISKMNNQLERAIYDLEQLIQKIEKLEERICIGECRNAETTLAVPEGSGADPDNYLRADGPGDGRPDLGGES